MKKNNTNKRDVSKKRSKRKKSVLQLFVLLSFVLAMVLLFVNPYWQNNSPKNINSRPEIEFEKEGQLYFLDRQDNQIITTIDIEIAEDDYERALGLMYRYSMSDSVGMLFIMEKEKLQSFWMKDTYISLDIIYLSNDLEIVTIQKNTQVLSEQSIPSYEKSKYVIEVNGGFCDKLNIEEGDIVKYERTVVYSEY